MKNIVIYYPFALAANPKSGSQIRPLEMIKSFEKYADEHNLELIVISGNSKERRQKWNSVLDANILEHTVFCYAENQTIPLWLTDPGHRPLDRKIDRDVFSTLKTHNIPAGIFYRDVYWKFDELYPLKGIKKMIMKRIYRWEELFYQKYMKTIFLPSEAMGKFVSIDLPKIPLPPGGRKIEWSEKTMNATPKGIYVGGINNDDYGLLNLAQAYEGLNSSKVISELHIVCREDEWTDLPANKKEQLQKPYIHVSHISGVQLETLYRDMDFAFIPRKKSTYNDFSVPVKLVEYLSAGLPIVATNCSAQEEIINSGPYGVVSGDQPVQIKDGILKMIEKHEYVQETIRKRFLQEHSWEARAYQAADALLGGQYENSDISSK